MARGGSGEVGEFERLPGGSAIEFLVSTRLDDALRILADNIATVLAAPHRWMTSSAPPRTNPTPPASAATPK
jgi:hypothetical protein